MRRVTAMLVALAALSISPVAASGPAGVFAIVEKVVFEPDAAAPQRIQIWGAFTFTEGQLGEPIFIGRAQRGYLYFELPTSQPGVDASTAIANVRAEWTDLKAMAGSGQAIAFGQWQGVVTQSGPPGVYIKPGIYRPEVSVRIRPKSEPPSAPNPYQTNTGIVKLSDQGPFAAWIKDLREALKRQ
jgi:hypothetical protein